MTKKNKGPVNVLARRWFDLTASANPGDPVKLRMYGNIGYYEIDADYMRSELAPYAGRDINLYIHSDGGDVFEGSAIYAALKDHAGTINAIVDSVCASITSLIIMAADKVLIRPTAQIMIHEARGWFSGTIEEVQAQLEPARNVNSIMAAAFAAKTGKPVEEIQADMKGDFWLDAAAAIEYGLADGLYESESDTLTASISGAPALTKLKELNAPPELIARYGQAQPEPAAPATPDNPQTDGNDMTEAEKQQLRAQMKQDEIDRKNAVRALFKPHLTAANIGTVLNACVDDMDCTVEAATSKLLAFLTPTAGGNEPNPPEPSEKPSVKAKALLKNRLHAALGAAKVEDANPYRFMSPVEAIRACMRDIDDAKAPLMNNRDLVAYAFNNGTDSVDLGNILEHGIKMVIDNEQAKYTPWHVGLVKRQKMDIGRANSVLKTSDVKAPLIKTEHGEFAKVKLSASKDVAFMGTKGYEIDVSRELIMSDNLGFINSEIAKYVERCAMVPQMTLLTMLKENPKLTDGKPIFSKEAGNLFTGAILDAAKLSEMSGDMADAQTGEGNPLNLVPHAVLSSNTEARRLKAMVGAKTIKDEPNLAYEAFAEVIGTAQLAKTGLAFAMAGGGHVGIVEGYNEQADGVQVETLETWKSDGSTVRIYIDSAIFIPDTARKGLQRFEEAKPAK